MSSKYASDKNICKQRQLCRLVYRLCIYYIHMNEGGFFVVDLQGYSIFQLKLGGDVNENVEQIQACREALSPEDVLIGDANGGLISIS